MAVRKRVPTTRLTLLAAVIPLLAIIASLFTVVPERAAAAQGEWFDPSYIISDALFFDSNAMTQGEIEAFLQNNIGTCGNSNCLNVVKTDTISRQPDAMCASYQGEPAESASAIIFKVQRACGISAKVLLVTLQKEQSLVTHRSPTLARLDRAMGYACPDNTVTPGWCDPSFGGLYNQIYRAAWQFKRYGNPPGTTNYYSWYPVGATTNIQFHPDLARCGSAPVHIKNRATAALYYYTPYQPNPSALANLYGTGDSCASYGNRNFWRMYYDWFGSPVGPVDPIGVVDLLESVPGAVRVAGWVFDPNVTTPTDVHVYVNGVGRAFGTGNNRPDVGAIYGVGANHGFDLTIPVSSSGPQEVCVYGINHGPGVNVRLACGNVNVMTGSPVGVVDSVVAIPGGVTVSGWVFDPDTEASTQVHVYVGGSGYVFEASAVRPDVDRAYPGYGAAHGYSVTVPAQAGLHRVCVYGIDIAGPGENRALACTNSSVLSGQPFGALDQVIVSPGEIRVTGWAFDPDSTKPSPVHVYMGARGYALTPDRNRADVAALYPGYGLSNGFDGVIPALPGSHDVCVYGIDVVAPGGNKQLGCRHVIAMSGPPVGVVDVISGTAGGLHIAGWVWDPDTASPTKVRIELNGKGTEYLADVTRPDVGLVYPAYGSNHGYAIEVPAEGGVHNVCVIGINEGPGGDTTLGCRVVEL